jgi:hypothetical protein
VVIQRCQAHKLRNVEEHLPEVMRPSVRNAIQEAYCSRNVERAKRILGNLARRLQDEHPGAAASLEEGLDETLTVMGFGLPCPVELPSTFNSQKDIARNREGTCLTGGLGHESGLAHGNAPNLPTGEPSPRVDASGLVKKSGGTSVVERNDLDCPVLALGVGTDNGEPNFPVSNHDAIRTRSEIF